MQARTDIAGIVRLPDHPHEKGEDVISADGRGTKFDGGGDEEIKENGRKHAEGDREVHVQETPSLFEKHECDKGAGKTQKPEIIKHHRIFHEGNKVIRPGMKDYIMTPVDVFHEKEGQEIEPPEGKGCDYRMFLRESDQIRRKETPCFFECFCSHTEHHTRFFSAGQRLPPSDSLRSIR